MWLLKANNFGTNIKRRIILDICNGNPLMRIQSSLMYFTGNKNEFDKKKIYHTY